MSSVHLNLFTYQRSETSTDKKGNVNTCYLDCTVTKAFGPYKPGQKIDSIVVQLSLHIWQGDDYVDEHVIIL